MNADSGKRVVRTFVIAFVGVAIPGALSWLNELTKWANDGGQVAFPDARSLAFLGVSAIVAGAVAVMNLIVVLVEDWSGHGLLRSVPARPQRGDTGAVAPTPRTVLAVIAVTAFVLLLCYVFTR